LKGSRRVKVYLRTEPGEEDQRQAFMTTVILFIALPPVEEKTDPG
jgi:hypothetical protein